MGDHHLQLLLLLHPVNTILNCRGNQIFYASYKGVRRCHSLAQILCTLQQAFFSNIFKCATKIQRKPSISSFIAPPSRKYSAALVVYAI